MKEISFFETDSIIVTQTRFIVKHKVVEIKNISYAKIGTLRSYITLKSIIAIVGFLMMFFHETRILGVIIFFAAFISVYFFRERFSVRIDTKNGETDFLVSKDKDFVEKIVNAINKAMWTNYTGSAPM